MSRTVYYTATSLDGFIADPDDSLDWLLRQPQDESATGPADFDSFFAEVGALAMGSTTYEWVLENLDGGWPYAMPTWVFTHRTLSAPNRMVGGGTPGEPGALEPDAEGAAAEGGGAGQAGDAGADDPPAPDVRFTQDRVSDVHAEMLRAASGQDLWIVGGGDLAGQFAEEGLLDEVIASIAPVTLGAGRPLLPRRLDLELVDVGRNAGFITARHRVLGPLLEDRAPDGGGSGDS